LKKELREAKKKEKEEAEKRDEKLGNQIAGKKGDEDPDGVKLLQTTDPLGDASKFLKNLQLYRPDEITTQLLAIQVYSRKKKYLLVVKALKKALTLDPQNPQANLDLITTLSELKTATLEPIVKQVIDLECKEDVLGANQPLSDLVDKFLKQNSNSLPHRFAAAKAYIALETKGTLSTPTKQKVIQLINPKLSELKKQPLHQECKSVYEFLIGFDNSAANEFKSQCKQLFPLTPFFNEPSEASSSSSKYSESKYESNHVDKPDSTIENVKKETQNEKQSQKESQKGKGSKSKSRTSSEKSTEN